MTIDVALAMTNMRHFSLKFGGVSSLKLGLVDAGSRPIQLHATLSGMDTQKTTLERAFDMARTGRHARLSDLINCLNREGYDGWKVTGPVLKKQLSNLIKEAQIVHANRP